MNCLVCDGEVTKTPGGSSRHNYPGTRLMCAGVVMEPIDKHALIARTVDMYFLTISYNPWIASAFVRSLGWAGEGGMPTYDWLSRRLCEIMGVKS